jgi:hypothetical protein
MKFVRRETEAPRGLAIWRAEPVPLWDALHILRCEAIWVFWLCGLAIGTMPHVEFEGTGYVLQSDVDAFNEACQCRNQKVYKPRPVKTVAS